MLQRSKLLWVIECWAECVLWSDLNLPRYGCQCQDCQDWARHDTKYKQKYHSKCKLFLYEREIAALNLAWVVAVSWVRDEAQIILTLETDSVKWKCDFQKKLLIRSCEMIFMAENLITFSSPSPSQHSMIQGPGRYFMLTNECWPPMFKHQTSRLKCDIQHNIAQAIQSPYLRINVYLTSFILT